MGLSAIKNEPTYEFLAMVVSVVKPNEWARATRTKASKQKSIKACPNMVYDNHHICDKKCQKVDYNIQGFEY